MVSIRREDIPSRHSSTVVPCLRNSQEGWIKLGERCCVPISIARMLDEVPWCSVASSFLLWHASWHFGHDVASLQGFRRKKQGEGAAKLASCLFYSNWATVTAVWQCALLWQLPAAMQLVAKTIGSRWLCPIVPWNSFKLKRWSIVLVADSLQENETPCILVL